MLSRDKFIAEIDALIADLPEALSESSKKFWEEFKATPLPTDLTENGLKILRHMEKYIVESNNSYTASSIGVGLGTTGKSVSGSMKKLINNGFVIKTNLHPVTYAITKRGVDRVFEEDAND